MYHDHKTAADRLTRSTRSIELSTRTLWLLSFVVVGLLLMAGRSDFAAVQAGLI